MLHWDEYRPCSGLTFISTWDSGSAVFTSDQSCWSSFVFTVSSGDTFKTLKCISHMWPIPSQLCLSNSIYMMLYMCLVSFDLSLSLKWLVDSLLFYLLKQLTWENLFVFTNCSSEHLCWLSWFTKQLLLQSKKHLIFTQVHCVLNQWLLHSAHWAASET